MHCKDCGLPIEHEDRVCETCTVEKITNEKGSNKSDLDERMIKAFIGKKGEHMYSSVRDGGLNIWAVLFGVFYYIYRKMYLIASLVMVSSILLIMLTVPISGFFSFLIGSLFCPFYRYHITKKLRQVKIKNPNASEDELLDIAKKKGGTSLIGLLVFSVVCAVALFILYQ